MATIVRDMVSISGIANTYPTDSTIFKEFNVNETIVLPECKPDIERILGLVLEANILSIRIVDTASTFGTQMSAEGEMLTGKKMIIEVQLKQKIKYVADVTEQTVHGFHNEFIVSEFVIIPEQLPNIAGVLTPEQLLKNNLFVVTPYIEDANIKMLDERTIYKNITMFIDIRVRQSISSIGEIKLPINLKKEEF